MTKENGDFCTLCELQKLLGGHDAMNISLCLDQIAPLLDWSSKASNKVKLKLPAGIYIKTVPLMELSFLPEDIHVKKWEASQNTDLSMQEFLGIDNALQTIHKKWQIIPQINRDWWNGEKGQKIVKRSWRWFCSFCRTKRAI